jgi:hypothetical protein
LNGSDFRVKEAAKQRLEARIREEGHVRSGKGRDKDDRSTEVER